MVGKTFTYLIGSESSALFFNSKNQDLNAEEVYSKLVTPVFGKGVAYDVPNKVIVIHSRPLNFVLHKDLHYCIFCDLQHRRIGLMLTIIVALCLQGVNIQ